MERSLTVNEATQALAGLVKRAHDRGEATTLLENGRPVARIVPTVEPARRRMGKQIAESLARERPRLGVVEAEAFEEDLRAARAEMPKPVSPWD